MALAENQPPKRLYKDLETTLDITERLWKKLKNDTNKYNGEIEIRVYQEHFQYAYHRTHILDTEDVTMLVGMYFAQKLGCRSPLFEVYDQAIQKEFEDHCDNVFNRSERLFFYPSSGVGMEFNEELYHRSKQKIADKLSCQC